jgi:ribonuclease BN (tRNA processing enzyme)
MTAKPAKNKFSVTILGSGTCVPSLARSAASVLVQTGENRIVLDAGAGTMRRLLEAGVSIFEVTHLLFSHFHPDHTGELVPFLFANKYPDPDRRTRPLFLGGGPGFSVFYHQLKGVFNEWIDGAGLLQLFDFKNKNDIIANEDLAVCATAVNHRPESIAFKITVPGGPSMVYSGDTDVCESLIAFSQNADLLICESALPDGLKQPGHLTPSLAGEIAARANVKKLVLTHFYPECDASDIVQQCRKTYAGPLILARDLLTIELDD